MDRKARFSRRWLFWPTLCLISAIYFVFHVDWTAASRHRRVSTLEPANSTLGFGAIIAVSHAKSSRRKALLHAANLTGVALTIPDQPVWTDKDVQAFRSPEGSRISKGSAMAWMGHLNALRWFLSTPHHTALILEDDVDWSVHIRPTQIPLAAAAFRSLLLNATSQTTSSSSDYWGPLTWELLHLGHCGDFLSNPNDPPPSDLASRLSPPSTTFRDPTLPPPHRLLPQTSAFFSVLQIPPHHRLIHRSRWPLCTFGYAITRPSAARLLSTFATEGAGGCQAYDVRILEACRDLGWGCWTLSPEVLRHVEGGSEIAKLDADAGKEGNGGEKGKWKEGKEGRGTPNIECGARGRGFRSEDEGVRGWLAGFVGAGGRCLGDVMEEDAGRWP